MPSERHSKMPSTALNVFSPITTEPGLATELSSRLAVFTVSPSTVYSFLLMLPISPATALPELIPMRMRSERPLLPLGVPLGEPLLHLERGADRALGVVGHVERRAEHGHDRVADVLVEHPLVRKITSVMRER